MQNLYLLLKLNQLKQLPLFVRSLSLLYEATWNQQAAFIAAHKAEIDTVVANNDAEAERMRGIIREAGGTP